ncbi:MAG: chorion class high-cysteine HCB protein 13 [Epulopiscium sp.]|nr:chorion class high-cysteine HCB protein 13 [Candidatus Epulonipiscium sp.]
MSGCGFGNGDSILWIILLLCCCGGNNGFGNVLGSSFNGDGGCSWLWIILLLCCCGNNGCGQISGGCGC